MKPIYRKIDSFPKATIKEDEQNYYINLGIGVGTSAYKKSMFDLDEAIEMELDCLM